MAWNREQRLEDPTNGTQPDLRLHLIPALPVIRPWMGIILGLLCLVLCGTLLDLTRLAAGPSLSFVTFTTAALGAYFIWTSVRSYRMKIDTLSISIWDTYAEFPLNMRSKKTVRFAYSEIRALQVFEGINGMTLIVGTDGDRIALSSADEIDQEVFETCIEEIRSRIARSPGGSDQIHAMAESHARSHRALEQRSVVTLASVGLLVAVFFGIDTLGNSTVPGDPLNLVFAGANVPVLVSDGQWFRLVSANLLHNDAIHLGLNLFALFLLGRIMESLTGSIRTLLVLLSSALAGAFVSYLFSSALSSLGASTAVFGLLGAMFVLQMKFYSTIPHLFRQSKSWWTFILLLNLLLPFAIEGIDLYAHLGGFAAGCLIIWLLYRPYEVYDPDIPVPRIATVGAALVGAVFLIGTAQAIAASYSSSPEQLNRFTRTAINKTTTDPILLNSLAWRIVIDPMADKDQLDLAVEAIELAVEMGPDLVHIADTQATAYFRLGRYDDAISIQRRVVLRDSRPDFTTQLARFLKARHDKSGPMYKGTARENLVEISLVSGSYKLSVAPEIAGGFTVYALIVEGGRIKGLVRCQNGPSGLSSSGREMDFPAPGNVMGVEPLLVLVDNENQIMDRMEPEWNYWPANPTTLALP
ncbi:MAG: rhomboid family intramembrane serine protease [Candidatus Latescibacteria bacterium]|nr:rhomboid family intramembrane serine protease [Candidatus Latescibacterota bacterium]